MVMGGAVKKVAIIMFLPFLLLLVAAFLGPFLQVGPLFAPEVIKPDVKKISPISGFSRLFSLRSLFEFAKGVLKLAIVGTVAFVMIYPYFDKFEHLIDMPLFMAMAELKYLVIRMLMGILVVLALIAGVDIIYQRYEYNKKMRMSRQEVRDEYKQSEGDPHVKARLRQLRNRTCPQAHDAGRPHSRRRHHQPDPLFSRPEI